jgi:hypothetical protein
MVLAKYGVAAYGCSTPTGQPSQRGSAPGGLQPAFWNALVAFLASLGKTLTAANYHAWFTDTFRSYASQVDLYERKPGLAARPGTSIHGIGYAVDWDNDRADWPVIQHALRDHGAAFGLVHPFSDADREEWHWQLIPGFEIEEEPEMNYLLLQVWNDGQKAGAQTKLASLGGRWFPNALRDHYKRTAAFPDAGKLAEFVAWARGAKLHGTAMFASGKQETF